MNVLGTVLAGSALALLWLAREAPVLPKDTLPAALATRPPFGLVAPEQPAPPEIDARHAELGRKLFFDPLLSADRSVSCASCHQPEHGFAQAAATSPGVHGRRTARNAPSLFNRKLGAAFMWDGRVPTLAEQVLQPVENPDEMGLALDELLRRLAADADYGRTFEQLFGGAPTRDATARALSAFVETLWLGDSPVDHFQAGTTEALTEEERTGLWVYESKGFCWRCHSGPNFSDERFHNTGVGVVDGAPEEGRFASTRLEADRGAFKTPTLRGVALNAPYMHDGSLATLEEVVAFYRRGGNANPALDPELEPLNLTDEEARRLVLFLRALSRVQPR